MIPLPKLGVNPFEPISGTFRHALVIAAFTSMADAALFSPQ